MGFCWMIVVTAELVGAQSGLGYMIQISRAQLQTDMVVGGMLVIGAIGFFLHEATVALERILVPWRFRGRELSTEA
jgi:ABC-type nitrate/sulfonate/bicarbonate transport system permease component